MPAGSRCAFSATRGEAAKRFALAAEAAETPLSIARAAYWRGRAAEAMGDADEARLHYESAASEPIAYYGQLAAERLGAKRLELARAERSRRAGADRDESVRAAEALYADGLDDLATALAFEAARDWRDEAQMAAMAEVVKRHGDAATQVQFGKIATLRGYAFDEMAFPSSGVPAFLPLAAFGRPRRASMRSRGRRASSSGARPRAPAPRGSCRSCPRPRRRPPGARAWPTIPRG